PAPPAPQVAPPSGHRALLHLVQNAFSSTPAQEKSAAVPVAPALPTPVPEAAAGPAAQPALPPSPPPRTAPLPPPSPTPLAPPPPAPQPAPGPQPSLPSPPPPPAGPPPVRQVSLPPPAAVAPPQPAATEPAGFPETPHHLRIVSATFVPTPSTIRCPVQEPAPQAVHNPTEDSPADNVRDV